MPWGLIPVSAFAQRALTVIFPPDPHYGGRPPEDLALTSGGSENKTLRPSCLGSQEPAGSKIKKCLRCADTAYSGEAVAAGP